MHFEKLKLELAGKKIPVLYGGKSAEREISLQSGAAVHEGLVKLGIESDLLDYPSCGWERLLQLKPDIAFIAMHGRGGEDGIIQGALENRGIAYTGSGVLASALAMDKYRCKLIWRALNLPTAPGRLVTDEDLRTSNRARKLFTRFGPTLAIKPSDEGSSVGVFQVREPKELIEAVEKAKSFSQNVLVESWVAGEEYTVGIVGTNTLPSIRLCPAQGFYDFNAKYLAGDTSYHCPSGLSADEEKRLGELALQAFSSLNCKGWGRVDFIRDASGQFFILEVNTIPGMTQSSLVPKAAAALGWSFEDLLLAILASV